jgi:hypothetical protein
VIDAEFVDGGGGFGGHFTILVGGWAAQS